MSVSHIASLVLITAWTLAVCLLMASRREKARLAARILGLMMAASELLRNGILLFRREFSVGYLPLHLCSYGMVLCLIYGLSRRSRGGVLTLVSLPGAVAALLFPNWSALPPGHFISLHGYFFHGLLLQGSLIPLLSGRLRLGGKDLRNALLFLLVSAAATALCNDRLGTNYMFLGKPSANSPLEALTAIPGPFGYQMGLALLAFCVIFLLWGLLMLGQRRGRIHKDF